MLLIDRFDIILLTEVIMKKVKKAVIPVAGFGTRFLPFTKAVPKEMLPIVDTPCLQYIIEECVKADIDEILLIIGKNKKCIEDHFDRAVELEQLLKKGNKEKELKEVIRLANLAKIYFIRQKEMNGSGPAVLEAEAFVGDEPFAVLYGDDLVYSEEPSIGQLKKAYETTGKTIVGVQKVDREQTYKYGIVNPGLVKGNYTELLSLVEKPKVEDAPSDLACMGRYIFTPDIFDIIKRTPPGLNGETYLTDSIAIMAKESGVFAYTFEGRRYDTGDKEGYLEATVEYALRDEKLSAPFKKYLNSIKGKLF